MAEPVTSPARAGAGRPPVDQDELRHSAHEELTQNILPFWSTVAVDHVHGGVHGSVDNELRVDPTTPRSAVLCARVLWTFSASAHALTEPSHLPAADDAYAYLVAHFIDPVHGGVFWSVDADGVVVDDRKQVYAQAFAIYALAEYARASGLAAPLHVAKGLIDLVERYGSDPEHGGYVEARSRDWSPIEDVRLSPREPNAPKSMNTLLHVMEAYTTVLAVTQDDAARARLAALVTTILDRVVDPRRGTFRMFFDLEWIPLSETVSFGHDIEGAWLVVAAAHEVGDLALVDRAERTAALVADQVLRHGLDHDGAVLYEYRPAHGDAPAETDRDSHWWAQAEGAVGFLDAYRITGERRFLEAAADCWRVITAFHVDRTGGDWFKVLDPDRRLRPEFPKVGPWECPYHHARACLEILRRCPVTPASQEGRTP